MRLIQWVVMIAGYFVLVGGGTLMFIAWKAERNGTKWWRP